MKRKLLQYGLYSLSFLVGIFLIIGAQYSFLTEGEIGLVSYVALNLSGLLFLPFIFILISNQSNLTREQVLKVAVGLWILSILLPLIGL